MIKSHLLNQIIQPLAFAPIAFALFSGIGFTFGSTEAQTSEEKPLTGVINRKTLDGKHFPWMAAGRATAKAEFAQHPSETAQVRTALSQTDVEVYFGSWCGDSQEHVPPFLALVNAPKSLKLIALDRHKTFPGFVNSAKIERLPTFIFRRNGNEIGRITETPTKSILEDTLAILK
ncbi:MAG: thioredoxin family protein [Cryobacterium sp.]|nr:thioredoxin family protein [Oligoflexia bacterium]